MTKLNLISRSELSRSKKLQIQIILIFSIAIILIIFVQSIYYMKLSRKIEENAEDYAISSIRQIEQNVDSIMSKILSTGYNISYNEYVQKYLLSGDLVQRKEYADLIRETINNIASLNNNIMNIRIINEENEAITFYTISNLTSYQETKNGRIYNDKVFYEPEVVTFKISDYYNYNNDIMYSYIFPIYQSFDNISGESNRIGTLTITCDTKIIEDVVSKVDIVKDTVLLIIDEKDQIISSNNDIKRGLNIDEYTNEHLKEENKFIYKENVIADIGWKLVGIISKEEAAKDLRIYREAITIVGIIMIFMLLVIGIILNLRISRPVSEIVEKMKRIGEENISERLKISSADEIGIIAENVNKMLDKIETMTNREILTQKKIYEIELSKKHTELSALQSQIRPHFLYNTLECMRSIATTYGAYEIIKMSTALAKIFRYSIKENNYVQLKKEIEIVCMYLEIMNVRFRNKFDITIDVPELIMEKRVLKMLLQPIVENALRHGLEEKDGIGSLVIKGRVSDDNMIISIKDNGVGINSETMKEIKNNMNNDLLYNKNRYIGIINTNRRIKLFFGGKYGLKLESEEDVGTLVKLVLPLEIDEANIKDNNI